MLPTSRVKPDPAAVGRDVDVLGDVGAVEQQRVVAALALDGVAAVARVPDEGVVAGAHQGHVVAAAADRSRSLPGLPMRTSSPSPPLRVRAIASGVEAARVDGVVARRGR